MGMRYKDHALKVLEELEMRVADVHRRGLSNAITQKEFDEMMERIRFIVDNLKQTIENEDVFMTN